MNRTAENITITVNTLLYIIGKLGVDGRFPQGIQDSVLRGSEALCEVRFLHYGRQVHRHVLRSGSLYGLRYREVTAV